MSNKLFLNSLSMNDFVVFNKAKWIEAFPKSSACQPISKYFGDPKIEFKFENEIPCAGVIDAEDLFVHSPHGWITDKKDNFLADNTWYGHKYSHELVAPCIDYETVRLKGTTCSILSDWANDNYGHLLLDSLPRLELVLKSGYKIDKIDNFIAPIGFKGAFDMLQKLGIKPEKIIFNQLPTRYICENLIAPTFPGARRTTTKWAVDYLKSNFQKNFTPNQMIYIPRSTSRLIQNEIELIAILKSFGFEVYDPKWETSKLLFSKAKIIVGASGAGLSDVIFCNDGATLIELVPTDHIYPYFINAANAAGVNHITVTANSIGKSIDGRFGPSSFDCVINLEFVKQALLSIL